MLYYLPLEPLENRYTIDWWWQFDKIFKKHRVKYVKIDGDVKTESTDGVNFLDWNTTFQYKFNQLSKLFSYDLKDDDWIFVADGEFPGLEALEYYRKMTKKKFKIASIWHAGTYDINDMTFKNGLEKIGKPMEEVLFDICDKIFVATNYHKKLISDNRMVDKDKIIVTGLPIDYYGLRKYKNDLKHGIIFTGRLAPEKGLDIINELENKALHIHKAIQFNYNKKTYLNRLGMSKIVIAPSKQETFGYGVVEGMAMDCYPIVPNGLSFIDYVPREYRYDDKPNLSFISDLMIKKSINLGKYVKKYDYNIVIKNMLKQMGLI
jgi:glycosyltransferase involved in cell wall biosynthesis